MKNIAIRFRFDKENKATKTKTGLLQIEVRELGTKDCVLLSTGIKLYKNQYSSSMGFTCKNHELADVITDQAHSIKNEIHSFALSENCKTLRDVKGWKDKSSKGLLFPFIEQEMQGRGMEYNTLKAHRTLLNKLKEFNRIKTFKDVSLINITEFDKWMRPGISNVTINKMHALFKMYIKIALTKGLLESNPYDRFTPPKAKNTDPVFLIESEVERLKSVKNLDDKLDRVRDLFLFQCYTGLAYADMQSFSQQDIQELDGKEIIRSSRIKTDESFILLFLPEAKEIAEKYNYQLPKISNQKYNDYLKLLIVHPKVKITKKVTTHTARHTFATFLINKGIPLESVSKILGHSNIKQSQHYARLLGKKVISDMSVLLKDEKKK